MAVCTKEIVFILPPKTGSAWVRTAMNNAKIEWWQDGDEHGHPKKPIKDRLVCTVVRNPLHWLRSYFMFQFISPVRLYPELDAILDRLKEPGDWCWNEFVREVTTKHPRFVTNLFDWYVSPYEGNGRFVLGKTETIVQDVVAALYEASVPLTVDQIGAIRATEPVNVCLIPKPEITIDHWLEILDSEKPSFDRYGYLPQKAQI